MVSALHPERDSDTVCSMRELSEWTEKLEWIDNYCTAFLCTHCLHIRSGQSLNSHMRDVHTAYPEAFYGLHGAAYASHAKPVSGRGQNGDRVLTFFDTLIQKKNDYENLSVLPAQEMDRLYKIVTELYADKEKKSTPTTARANMELHLLKHLLHPNQYSARGGACMVCADFVFVPFTASEHHTLFVVVNARSSVEHVVKTSAAGTRLGPHVIVSFITWTACHPACTRSTVSAYDTQQHCKSFLQLKRKCQKPGTQSRRLMKICTRKSWQKSASLQ